MMVSGVCGGGDKHSASVGVVFIGGVTVIKLMVAAATVDGNAPIGLAHHLVDAVALHPLSGEFLDAGSAAVRGGRSRARSPRAWTCRFRNVLRCGWTHRRASGRMPC